MRVSLLMSLLILAAVFVLGPARPSSAADDPREIARGHYSRGLDLAGQQDYEAALREFTEAYRVSPHFAVLYNVGQAQVALGRPLEAVETLSKYLRDGQEQVPPDRRRQVESQIKLLESLFAELVITTDRPGAVISVDGREIGRTPLFQSVRLAAGTHKVSGAVEGGPVVPRTVTLGQGERQFLNLELPASPSLESETPAPHPPPVPAPVTKPAAALEPVAVPPPSAPREQQPEPALTRSHLRSALPYALAGVGAALGGGALAVYLSNRGRYQDWQNNNAALQRDKGAIDHYTRQIANNQLADSLTRANHVVLGLSIAGGLLFAGGITLLIRDRFHDGTRTKEETPPGTATTGVSLDWGWQGSSSGGVSWSATW